jgi:protein TonB
MHTELLTSMKKLLTILALSFVLSPNIIAQNDSINMIITYMSSAPIFSCGNVDEFLPWLYKNIEYPKSALSDSISGKVFARFLIDSTGYVRNVAIIKGVRNDIDSAVIKVLLKSPKWIPAKQQDKSIGVPITIPVQFDVNDPNFKKQIYKVREKVKKKQH